MSSRRRRHEIEEGIIALKNAIQEGKHIKYCLYTKKRQEELNKLMRVLIAKKIDGTNGCIYINENDEKGKGDNE